MRRWVLLRGLARESGHWGGFPRALARATGDQVLALDLPGNGTRWAEPCPASIPTLAEDLRRHLPLSRQPTVLLAMSLGAMVAVEWASRHAGELAGCVLVNTSGGGASPFWRRLRPGRYADIARIAWPMTSVAARDAAVLRMTTRGRHPRADLLAQWTALARAHPVSAMNAARQLWAAARYRIPPAPPASPLLLLSSLGDALVHPACSEDLAQRWQAPHEVHPWAGHDLPLDDPGWVLDRVLRWAAALPRA